MVESSCGVKKLFAVAVPVWRVCARELRPRGCAWGGKRGCFLGEGGEGAKKVFGVLPVATAQISSGLRFSSWRGRKKSLGEYLAGTGERPIFAPASDKDEGRGRGGGSGGSLRQCSEKKEEQKVNRSVAGAKDTRGPARRRRPAISTMESLILAQDER